MKKILFGAFCLASLAVSALTPEQSGGIYYAYPYTTDSLAPVPAGFKPVYMSHYGRHGSRWAIDFSEKSRRRRQSHRGRAPAYAACA